MSGIFIGEAIYTLLGDAGVERRYPNIAEQETNAPFVVYRIGSYSPARSKDGEFEDRATIYITAVADTYDASLQLAEKVRGIEKWSGESKGFYIGQIVLDNISTSYQGTAHVVELTYTMTINI